MKQYYCLVAISRTGSTALEKALGSHESIYHDMTRLPSLKDSKKWVNDFQQRCEVLPQSWCGFKCLMYQYDSLEQDILTNPSFKKIILIRQNMFEAALSKKVAEAIGNWHTIVDYSTVKPFEIPASWFIPYIKLVRQTTNNWIDKSNNYEVFYYEDLFFSPDTYQPVLDFLGLKESPHPYTIQKSNNYRNIKNIITNYDQLKEEYEKIR